MIKVILQKTIGETAMENPIKPNTKIRILSPEHSEYVQRLAFKTGARWRVVCRVKDMAMHTDKPFLYFDGCLEISYGVREGVFKQVDYTEIFIDLPVVETLPEDHVINDSTEDQKHDQLSRKHSHYFKDVSDLKEVDVYAVCELFNVNDPSGATQHAIKKLLCSGQRGAKDYKKDLQEARDTLNRKLELMENNQ